MLCIPGRHFLEAGIFYSLGAAAASDDRRKPPGVPQGEASGGNQNQAVAST